MKLGNVECKEQNQSANLNNKFEENPVGQWKCKQFFYWADRRKCILAINWILPEICDNLEKHFKHMVGS